MISSILPLSLSLSFLLPFFFFFLRSPSYFHKEWGRDAADVVAVVVAADVVAAAVVAADVVSQGVRDVMLLML